MSQGNAGGNVVHGCYYCREPLQTDEYAKCYKCKQYFCTPHILVKQREVKSSLDESPNNRKKGSANLSPSLSSKKRTNQTTTKIKSYSICYNCESLNNPQSLGKTRNKSLQFSTIRSEFQTQRDVKSNQVLNQLHSHSMDYYKQQIENSQSSQSYLSNFTSLLSYTWNYTSTSITPFLPSTVSSASSPSTCQSCRLPFSTFDSVLTCKLCLGTFCEPCCDFEVPILRSKYNYSIPQLPSSLIKKSESFVRICKSCSKIIIAKEKFIDFKTKIKKSRELKIKLQLQTIWNLRRQIEKQISNYVGKIYLEKEEFEVIDKNRKKEKVLQEGDDYDIVVEESDEEDKEKEEKKVKKRKKREGKKAKNRTKTGQSRREMERSDG